MRSLVGIRPPSLPSARELRHHNPRPRIGGGWVGERLSRGHRAPSPPEVKLPRSIRPERSAPHPSHAVPDRQWLPPGLVLRAPAVRGCRCAVHLRAPLDRGLLGAVRRAPLALHAGHPARQRDPHPQPSRPGRAGEAACAGVQPVHSLSCIPNSTCVRRSNWSR